MLHDALGRMHAFFAATALMNGLKLQKKGNVLNVRLSDGLVKARVKSDKGQIFDVFLDLKQWPSTPSQCACVAKVNCEHAAAALFCLQDKENLRLHVPTTAEQTISMEQWIQSIEQASKNIQRPKQNTHHIVYLLEEIHTEQGSRFVLELAQAKTLKQKRTPTPIPFYQLTDYRMQFLDEQDEAIFSRLPDVKGWFDRFMLRDSSLFEAILATERAYFKEDLHTPIALGPPEHAHILWHLTPQGMQIPQLCVGEVSKPWVFIDSFWIVDAPFVHRAHLPYPPSASRQCLIMPPIGLDEIDDACVHLTELSKELPLVTRYTERTQRYDAPEKQLLFNLLYAENKNEKTPLLVATPVFCYHAHRVQASCPQDMFYSAKAHHLYIEHRDVAFEANVMSTLEFELGLRRPKSFEKLTYPALEDGMWVVAETDIQWLMKSIVPTLQSKGFHVEFQHEDFEEEWDEADVEWFSDFQTQGASYFAYQEGVQIDGESVNLVPVIASLLTTMTETEIEAMEDTQRIKLSLGNGKALHVQWLRIKPLLLFVLQYGSKIINAEDRLVLSRYQLMLLEETRLAGLAVSKRWQPIERVREQLHRFIAPDASIVEPHPPQGLNAHLRDYQAQGMHWLQRLRANGFGGILADDMGLGKTIQTLSHLLLEKEEGRATHASLIVVPTSLVVNWYEEAKRFTPDLKVLIYHGVARYKDEFDDYDLVISTYGIVHRDKDAFLAYPFYYLILDEAQWIKNAKAKTTQVILQLKAQHRLCLSGTPLENHLGELWSLFHFLMPGLLGDMRQFRRFFRAPIEKEHNRKRQHLLASRVKPFLLRRTKNQVAKELPEKTEIIRHVEMDMEQRELYEAIRLTMESKVREAIGRVGLGKSRILLLDALLKLRQVCCDPRLLKLEMAEKAHGHSAKLDALMDLLANLMEEERSVLIFSQFTSMLEWIETQLQQKRYTYLKLTGQTKNRHELVTRFQNGEAPIFLISLKAGGTGLNLTKADTVIHYDPWWNPAAEDQAADRSHRIGQKNPVFVYKLICQGSLEETILTMQKQKRALFSGVFDAASAQSTQLTEADLDKLFMPLGIE